MLGIRDILAAIGGAIVMFFVAGIAFSLLLGSVGALALGPTAGTLLVYGPYVSVFAATATAAYIVMWP